MEYKGVHIATTKNAITDIDAEKGVIKGYFSIFGNVDSDEDIIMPGAYTKTLNENYRRIKHLYQHDPFKPLSGTNNDRLKVFQDNIGLGYESTITPTSWGKDMILLHQDRVIDENSVGFKTVRSVDRSGYREIQEVKLFEGSSVTWGANEMAMSKSMDKESICKKMNNVMKAIRNGKYENEELFDLLDIYFKQLQTQLENIATPPAITATAPVKNGVLDGLKSYLNT